MPVTTTVAAGAASVGLAGVAVVEVGGPLVEAGVFSATRVGGRSCAEAGCKALARQSARDTVLATRKEVRNALATNSGVTDAGRAIRRVVDARRA